jgi:3',5'-cyclic AMP phosphodiesterase CpdA
MTMFVLAHLSDPHIGPLPPARLSELASKRLLGFLNWRRRRGAIHRLDILEALRADLAAQSPDHVAVTGDLVNIALAGEFAPARAWLEQLGPPHDVTLVPGNHDAYVRGAPRAFVQAWGDYMRGDEPSAPAAFPFVRRRCPVALVGLSSAVPTAPFMATGMLGREQISKMADILSELQRERLFRVVLIHHPPVSAHGRRHKRLTDSSVLRAALAKVGAELVLHGHDHVPALVWLDGPAAPIPAIGVPSASAGAGGEAPAAYNLYRIGGAHGAWRCEAVSRGHTGAGAIGEIRRCELTSGG